MPHLFCLLDEITNICDSADAGVHRALESLEVPMERIIVGNRLNTYISFREKEIHDMKL